VAAEAAIEMGVAVQPGGRRNGVGSVDATVLVTTVEETQGGIDAANGEGDVAAGRLKVVGRERVWKSVDEGIDGVPGWGVSVN